MYSLKGTLCFRVTLPQGAAVLTSAQVVIMVMQPMCLWLHFVNHSASNIKDIGLPQVSTAFHCCTDEGGVKEGEGERSCRHTKGVA